MPRRGVYHPFPRIHISTESCRSVLVACVVVVVVVVVLLGFCEVIGGRGWEMGQTIIGMVKCSIGPPVALCV